MIKLQIVGHLGRDCKVNDVNGRSVINFTVAHSERFKDSQGVQKERTTWVECAYWTDRTAIAQYLTKGKLVYAEGSPEADGYTNKEGQPAATLRMRVQNIQLLGGNDQNSGSNFGQAGNSGNVSGQGFGTKPVMQSQPAGNTDFSSAGADDDLPF